MPELPEVETVVQTLKNMIIDDEIISVDIHWANTIDKISLNDFKNKIKNQKINDITRFGKIIAFVLDDYLMFTHLRMEGKYYVDDKLTLDKHSHVVFHLKSNRFLRYHDVRKFGKISLIEKANYLSHPYLINLGKEPFVISVSELQAKLANKNIEIKAALLDQHIMAGLGNIYVDEVLFRARVHPETRAKLLNKKQLQSIIDNAIIVLNKAIELGGTTIRSYTSSLGVSGKFQNELLVHTKQNLPCPNCQRPITKIKVKGRGTYLCQHCQKKLSD
ncbi:DNA-formamidopyrimidine glycosylase [Erysipelotrichaceae bacterium OttesenSCG-928-M19]|nr:DNA-formamidopyrimidine glycosylase [Erysipelotrichaceae bacterium OttesenSCG-928-M19]